jgi:CDP-paratose 2-epimerase
MSKIAIITGSSGLIGSESVNFFIKNGFNVIGIDNDMRKYFFGDEGSTNQSKESLIEKYTDKYKHYDIDIRSFDDLSKIFKIHGSNIKIIIHTAAQPSHDWAAKEPITDFTVNANGTINLLELCRLYCNTATFIFTSTNKVYGDLPNNLKLSELDKRFDLFDDDILSQGITENMSIDNSKHSVFGASKVAADVMCQEYGKYFDMNVGIFRGGCLTGPNHSGTELHGFLSYLIKCIVNDLPYTIFGYKGKQVRDNIHSLDLVNAFWHFHQSPKKGEVYNIGGGRSNSISIIEVIEKVNLFLGKNWNKYTIVDENRIGDHKWYITNYSKFKSDFPSWNIQITIDQVIKEIIKINQKNDN